MSVASPERRLLIRWGRDLSALMPQEIRERWGEDARLALNGVLRRLRMEGFEETLAGHNPIYYVAQRVFFDDVLDDPDFLYAPLHRERLCDQVMGYVSAPHGEVEAAMLYLGSRETYKTTFFHGACPMTMAFRTFRLSDGRRHAVQALVHHKEEIAQDNLVRLKAKFQSHKWVREFWPEFCPPPGREWGTKSDFTFPCVPPGAMPEPSVSASSLKSLQTGRHFDFKWHDDIENEDHAESLVNRRELKRLYNTGQYTRRMKTGREINSGTPYHPRGLWMDLQKAEIDGKPLCRVVVVPAIADDGTLAHPHKLSAATLEQMRLAEIARTGNDDNWWLQMMLKVHLTRRAATDPAWIRWVKKADVEKGQWGCIIVDPAWKGTENQGEGDQTCIEVWRFRRHGGFVLKTLVDGVLSDELTAEDGIDEIFRLARQHKIHAVAPEEIGGRSFRQRLKNEAVTRAWPLQVIDLKSTNKSKENQRIPTFTASVQAGRVFVVEELPEPLKTAFIEQYAEFGSLDHDDALDCAAYTEDPGITESYVPHQWDDEDTDEDFAAPLIQPATRYCGR